MPDRRSARWWSGIAAVLMAAAPVLPGCATPGRPDPAVSPPVTVSSSPHGHQDPGLGDDEDASPRVAAARAVANGFARAWVRRDLPAAQWWAGVSPWCTPGYAAALRTADPTAVPAGRVIGMPMQTTEVAATVTFEVRADTGVIVIAVAVVNSDPDPVWRVADVGFTRDDIP